MASDKTLYMQIYEFLKERIINKRILPGQQLPTELELAEQFGVSRITSKNALNQLESEGLVYRKRGKGTFVSASAPKIYTQSMNKVIAMVFPFETANNSSGFVMSYVNGAMSYLAPRGYYISIHCTEWNYNIERNLLKSLPASGVGGIIYSPESSTRHIDILNLLCLDKYPIVTIDKYYEGIQLSSVVSDNFNGQYKLTEELIKMGHRKMTYLTRENIEDKTSIRDRYFGYCKALKDNNIDIDKDTSLLNFHFIDSEKEEVKFLEKNIAYLLKRGVTAILVENDIEAIKVGKVILNMGLSIPKDISITGFDDLNWLEHFDLKLTTVKQNNFEIGRRAAEIIVKMIEEGYEYVFEKIPTEVIVRETTDTLAYSRKVL